MALSADQYICTYIAQSLFRFCRCFLDSCRGPDPKGSIYIYICVLESSRALDSLTTHDLGHSPLDVKPKTMLARDRPSARYMHVLPTLITFVLRKLPEHCHKEPMDKRLMTCQASRRFTSRVRQQHNHADRHVGITCNPCKRNSRFTHSRYL